MSPDNPDKPKKRKPKKLPVFLSPAECDRLLSACSSQRDRLIVLCGLLLGLRVSEICNLRIERVNFELEQVLIFQGKGGKDRLLPMNQRLADEMRAWICGRTEGWLFPSPKRVDKPVTTRAVQYLISKLAKAAGITRLDGQTCHPHTLRHSFCTTLIRKRVDLAIVRDLAGHSSIQTTSRYLHSDTEHLKNAVNLL